MLVLAHLERRGKLISRAEDSSQYSSSSSPSSIRVSWPKLLGQRAEDMKILSSLHSFVKIHLDEAVNLIGTVAGTAAYGGAWLRASRPAPISAYPRIHSRFMALNSSSGRFAEIRLTVLDDGS